jgi:hypothetical protein
MNKDPIIEELHAIRQVISKESDDDIKKIAEAAKMRQLQGNRKVVQRQPRKAKSISKAS